jgi:hypothetical protein
MANRPTHNDKDATLRAEEEVRRRDPHSAPPAATADADDPQASPSPDRSRKADALPDEHSGDAARAPLLELPAVGFPPFEQPLTDWFHQKYRRAPTERELGAMMAAMNERDAPGPRVGPKPDLEGWRTDLSAPPAPRR